MPNQLILNKRLHIWVHILTWTALFILPAYLLSGDSPRDKAFLSEVWFQIAFYCLIFYVSYLWLAPRFFFTRRKGIYFLLIILLIIILTILVEIVHQHYDDVFSGRFRGTPPPGMNIHDHTPRFPPPPFPGKKPGPVKNWPLFNFMLTSALISGLSLGIRLSEKLTLNEKLRKEAEKARTDQELVLLKNQINPHFLFNTLNSIYSLALTKSDYTAEAVMKLSEMMRYMLQDVQREKVPLEQELGYISHFVELQRLRLSEMVKIVYESDKVESGLEIAPIMLVPFIENAFKHGTSAHAPSEIRIEIRVREKELYMKVTNQVFPGREEKETFGIGLKNTRKRLELLYPGKHQLEVGEKSGQYVVNLRLQLS